MERKLSVKLKRKERYELRLNSRGKWVVWMPMDGVTLLLWFMCGFLVAAVGFYFMLKSIQ